MLTRRHRRSDRIAAPLARPALSNDVRVSSASDSNGRRARAQDAERACSPTCRARARSARARAATRPRAAAQGANGAATRRAEAGREAQDGGVQADGESDERARPRTARSRRRGGRRTRAGAPSAKARAPGTGSAPGARRARPATARTRAAESRDRASSPRATAPAGSVQPPGGAELVASAAEIVGELAKAGLSAGERLLKDACSRLPLLSGPAAAPGARLVRGELRAPDVCILPPTPSCRDPGRGRRGTQCGSTCRSAGANRPVGAVAPQQSAARARQLTP